LLHLIFDCHFPPLSVARWPQRFRRIPPLRQRRRVAASRYAAAGSASPLADFVLAWRRWFVSLPIWRVILRYIKAKQLLPASFRAGRQQG